MFAISISLWDVLCFQKQETKSQLASWAPSPIRTKEKLEHNSHIDIMHFMLIILRIFILQKWCKVSLPLWIRYKAIIKLSGKNIAHNISQGHNSKGPLPPPPPPKFSHISLYHTSAYFQWCRSLDVHVISQSSLAFFLACASGCWMWRCDFSSSLVSLLFPWHWHWMAMASSCIHCNASFR